MIATGFNRKQKCIDPQIEVTFRRKTLDFYFNRRIYTASKALFK